MPDFVLEWGMNRQHQFAYATAETEAEAKDQAYIFACKSYDNSTHASEAADCECCQGTGFFTDTDEKEICDVCEGSGIRLKTPSEYHEDCENSIYHDALSLDSDIYTEQWLIERDGEDLR